MVNGCMVYTERAETATVSRGTRRMPALHAHHLAEKKAKKKRKEKKKRKKEKKRKKKLVTHVETHTGAANLLESGE